MLRVHLPPFSLGASYQQSPTTMSGRPSLLTSTTQTPSERKASSTTVFFAVIFTGALAGPSPAGNRVTMSASNRTGRRNVDRPIIADLGEKDHGGRERFTEDYAISQGSPQVGAKPRAERPPGPTADLSTRALGL